jgi:hypothetical protein
VPPKPEPAILDVRSGLGETRTALLALGATAPENRSVAFTLDEHLLLLDYDELERCTTIAVGGSHAVETAHRLAHALEGAGQHVRDVLPAMPRAEPVEPAPPARPGGAGG